MLPKAVEKSTKVLEASGIVAQVGTVETFSNAVHDVMEYEAIQKDH